MVEELPSAWVAEQKLPNPWVGYTSASSGSTEARRCAEANWACASSPAWARPSRSGRPVEPYSSDPPVNTACAWPAAASTYDRWVKVCPGVASTRTRITGLTSMTSPSATGTRSKATSSAALTW